MSFKKNIWCEKYRPKTIDEIVMKEEDKKILQKFKDEKDITNLFIVGSQGIGKTSLAKIIVDEILDCQYLYINASDENGIDVIREKVVGFVQTKSFNGKLKVVILDEADGISHSGQQALRGVIEDNLDNSRFILTANYTHRIIDPIQSRCKTINISYDLKQFVKQIFHILSQEKAQYDPKGILSFITNTYPDFRGCINELQTRCIDGKIDSFIVADKEYIKYVFAQILKKEDILKIRQYLTDNQQHFLNDYEYLAKELFNFTLEQSFSKKTQKISMLIALNNILRTNSVIIDPQINFLGGIAEIMSE